MVKRTSDAHRFSSSDEVEQLVALFRDCTLPYERWTHEAHLAVGVWHLLRFGPEETSAKLRSNIRRYNVACGIDNTDSSGYHETVTLFYVRIILDYLQRAPSQALDELVNGLVDSEYGSRKAPLGFYSRELLFSVAARCGWCEPDLKPLPPLPA